MQPPRPPWRRALLEAAAVLYLPQLAAFVIGPLTECDHCTGLYIRLYPIVPGHPFGMALVLLTGMQSDLPFFLVWGAGAVLLLAGVTWGMRLLGRRRLWLAAPVALLAGVHSVMLAHLLRM